MNARTFDGRTARLMESFPHYIDGTDTLLGGFPRSINFFYRDAAGSVCLVVEGRSPKSEVAITKSAIETLDGLAAPTFIRIINKKSKLDLIAPRGDILLGEPVEVRNRQHFIVRPGDFPEGSETILPDVDSEAEYLFRRVDDSGGSGPGQGSIPAV